MTSLDREVVRRKLAHLAEALEALRPLARLSFSDGTFVGLGDAGVLEGGLATRLAPSAGLRNRLVHEYNGLDDHKVHGALGEALEGFAGFVAQVEQFLEREAP